MAMNLRKMENPTRMVRNEKIYFRDTGLFIHSSADGKITISADGTGVDDITLSGSVTCSDSLTVNGNMSFGDLSTDTLTLTGQMDIGSSGTPITLATYAAHGLEVYTTCASTDGSNSVESIYAKSVMTGVGGVGGRARFHTYSNVASGGWINALKGYMEFGASGSTSGLASAICAELVLSAGTSHSAYAALEGELVLASGALTGERTSFLYLNTSGDDASTFDTNGYLFHIGDGITAAAGKFCSATYQTLKCFFTDSSTTRYAVLSQMEDGLGLGVSGTAMSLGTTATNKAIAVYTTSGSTDAGTSVAPIYMEHTMTGIGGVGGRAHFYMTTNVALGGWSNALKGQVVYGASGRTTGLGSAVCVEMTMSAGTSSGTYAPLEIELNMGASGVCGTATSLMYLSVNDAAATTFQASGYLMNIQGLGAATTTEIFQENTAAAATHALRILIGSTPYYIMLTSAGA